MNKKKLLNNIIIVFIILLQLFMIGCQNNQNIKNDDKQAVAISEAIDKNLTEQQKVFVEFWELYDRYYPSFNRKGIDWQSVYNQYYPQITNKTTDDELFEILTKIMTTINDGHSHLEYKEQAAGAADNFHPQLMEMLEKNRAAKVKLEASSIDNPYLSYGTLLDDENIGYIHSKRFEPMSEKDKEFDVYKKIVDEALNKLKNKRSIVIDVRDNGGGQGAYSFYLAGRFLNSSIQDFARQRYKTDKGNAESSFSQWVTEDYAGIKDKRAEEGVIGSFEPSELDHVNLSGDFQFTKPVIVLTSKGTASAAEYFTLAMKTQSHVSTVGNTTFGIFSGSERITLENGNGKWITNISVQDVEIKYNGSYKNFEGRGVEPDYMMLPSEDQIKEGRDIHLEKAIEITYGKKDDNSHNSMMDLKTEISNNLKGYKITFASSGKEQNNNIWIANVDGTDARQLTDGKGIDMYPEWSGDGQSIYYTSNKHGGALELYKVNTVGEPIVQQISQFGKEVRSLSVSADNNMIAMGIMSDTVPFGEDLKPYSADLYVITMEKIKDVLNEDRLLSLDDLTLLLSEPQEKHIWHEQPSFQKINTSNPYIAYVRTENYDNDPIMKDSIWTVRADGSGHKMISENGSMPQWALNDEYIVTHEFNLINIKTNESKTLKIDGLTESAGSASISPDGQYVIFETSDENRKAGLAKVVYKGSSENNPIVMFSDLDAYEPRWSPVPVENSKETIVDNSYAKTNLEYIDYPNEENIISTKGLGGEAEKYYTKYIEYLTPNGKSIKILAQDKISDEQLLYAHSIMTLYLKNLTKVYGENIANMIGESGNYLVMPNGQDDGSAGDAIIGQPQYQLETANVGSKWYMENDYEHRDSTFEEVFHFVHDSGIGNVSNERGSKKLAHMINDGKNNALPKDKKDWGKKGIWGVNAKESLEEWASEEGSLEAEYIICVIDTYYGLWEASDTTALFGEYLGKSRESLKTVDPVGLQIVESFLPKQMNVMMRVDPSFEGTFKMYLDNKEQYTFKSQYLNMLSLTGKNNSGIIANDNDNILLGNSGDNFIDGRVGIDVVQFTGYSDEYVINSENKTIIVSDQMSRDGTDTLTNVEILRFKDKDVKVNN